MVLNELLGQTKVIYEVTEDYISVLLTFLIILKMMIIGKVSEPMPQVIRTQPALYTARFPYFQYIQDFPFLKPSEVCHFEFYFCSKTYRTFFFQIFKKVTVFNFQDTIRQPDVHRPRSEERDCKKHLRWAGSVSIIQSCDKEEGERNWFAFSVLVPVVLWTNGVELCFRNMCSYFFG